MLAVWLATETMASVARTTVPPTTLKSIKTHSTTSLANGTSLAAVHTTETTTKADTRVAHVLRTTCAAVEARRVMTAHTIVKRTYSTSRLPTSTINNQSRARQPVNPSKRIRSLSRRQSHNHRRKNTENSVKLCVRKKEKRCLRSWICRR